MKMIRFRCKYCDRKLEVDPKGGGLRVPCPECGRIIRIPTHKESTLHLDMPPEEMDITRTKTITITLSQGALKLRRIIAVTSWVFLFIGLCLAFIVTGTQPVAVPFLIGAFVFAMVLIIQRKIGHGVAVMVLAFVALQFVVVNLIRNDMEGAVPCEEALQSVVNPAGTRESSTSSVQVLQGREVSGVVKLEEGKGLLSPSSPQDIRTITVTEQVVVVREKIVRGEGICASEKACQL